MNWSVENNPTLSSIFGILYFSCALSKWLRCAEMRRRDDAMWWDVDPRGWEASTKRIMELTGGKPNNDALPNLGGIDICQLIPDKTDSIGWKMSESIFRISLGDKIVSKIRNKRSGFEYNRFINWLNVCIKKRPIHLFFLEFLLSVMNDSVI